MIPGLVFNFFIDFALIAIPVFLVVRKARNFKKALGELGFKKMAVGKTLKMTGKLFLLLVAVSLWLSLILGFLGLNDLELVSESIRETRLVLPLFFWIVVVRVVSEETFFRGFLVKRTGAIGSSAIFAFFHLGYGSLAEVIGAFVLGYVLAKAFQLNKNLYPNILAHIAYNAIAIFALM